MVGIKIAILSNNNWLCKNGYSLEEQGEIYDLMLQDVIDNPRWYLDNAHSLKTVRVGWHTYEKMGKAKSFKAVIPREFVNKEKYNK